MLDLTGFRLMRRVAHGHGRSRWLACREHHRQRLRKRNMGAPLHSHFSNDMLRFQEDLLFSRTGQAFFSFASFLSFFSFSFSLFFIFYFLERDCLLCAICDTWLRTWKRYAQWTYEGWNLAALTYPMLTAYKHMKNVQNLLTFCSWAIRSHFRFACLASSWDSFNLVTANWSFPLVSFTHMHREKTLYKLKSVLLICLQSTIFKQWKNYTKTIELLLDEQNLLWNLWKHHHKKWWVSWEKTV